MRRSLICTRYEYIVGINEASLLWHEITPLTFYLDVVSRLPLIFQQVRSAPYYPKLVAYIDRSGFCCHWLSRMFLPPDLFLFLSCSCRVVMSPTECGSLSQYNKCSFPEKGSALLASPFFLVSDYCCRLNAHCGMVLQQYLFLAIRCPFPALNHVVSCTPWQYCCRVCVLDLPTSSTTTGMREAEGGRRAAASKPSL